MTKLLVAFLILASMNKKQCWIHTQYLSFPGTIYKVKSALCGAQRVTVFSLNTHRRLLLNLLVNSNSASDRTKWRPDTSYAGSRKPRTEHMLSSTDTFWGKKCFKQTFRDVFAPVICPSPVDVIPPFPHIHSFIQSPPTSCKASSLQLR